MSIEDDNFYDSSTRKLNADQQKEYERLRKRKLGDIRRVLSLKEGRRVLWEILSEAGVFRASFTQNSNQTAFNEGRRDIGLLLLKLVHEADPEAYARMQREFTSEMISKITKENLDVTD